MAAYVRDNTKIERIHAPWKHSEVEGAPIMPIFSIHNWGDRTSILRDDGFSYGMSEEEEAQVPPLTASDIIPHIPECDSEYCAVSLNRMATYHIFKRIADSWELIGIVPLHITAFRAGGYYIQDVYGNDNASCGISGCAE